MSHPDRYWQAKKVTLIGAIVNGLLGCIKLIGGILFHSHALFADGIHSFSDLLTDVMVLFASKYGSLDADESHPYGHQRIETAATLLLSLFLILAGAGIAWDAMNELITQTHTRPSWLTLPIIIMSIAANELLFHYMHFVGEKIQSPLIIANAWHHRSDAASSLVVLIGLIGSLAGYLYLDAFAAVVVGLMIVKMGWDYGWNSVKELVDTAVEPELLLQIEDVIQQVAGVERIHQLRSRFMGGDVFIDVHILVSPQISVSEGHYIAQHVHNRLMEQFKQVKDVIVHVDPEDDEVSSPSLGLPNRDVVRDLLLNDVQLDYPEILFWNLHYLKGKIIIDIACEAEFTRWHELNNRVMIAIQLQDDIDEVRLFSLQETIRVC